MKQQRRAIVVADGAAVIVDRQPLFLLLHPLPQEKEDPVRQ
jgi:hypothetical protein